MLGQLGNEATRLDGQATQTIDPSSNPEKNMKKLDKAIVKLLKNYPPKTEVEVMTVCANQGTKPYPGRTLRDQSAWPSRRYWKLAKYLGTT